jgi:hypothetical protein
MLMVLLMKKKFLCLFIFIPLLFEFSLSNCGSSDKNMEKDKNNEKITKQTSPGVNSAKVEAEIIEFEEKGDYTNSEIKILQVKSYGASVPPLPIGTIIKAEVTISSIKNSNIPKEELLRKGAIRNVTMEHFIVPSIVTSPSWRIMSIE